MAINILHVVIVVLALVVGVSRTSVGIKRQSPACISAGIYHTSLNRIQNSMKPRYLLTRSCG